MYYEVDANFDLFIFLLFHSAGESWILIGRKVSIDSGSSCGVYIKVLVLIYCHFYSNDLHRDLLAKWMKKENIDFIYLHLFELLWRESPVSALDTSQI